MRFHQIVVLIVLLSATGVAADTIELENGDRLEVTVIEERDETIIAEHMLFGRIEIPKSAVKPPPPPESEVPGIFGSDILRGWTRSLGAGVSGASGNSKDASFNTSLKIGRSAETFRGAFDAGYFFATKDGDKTTNQFNADYRHDFLFRDSKFFLFGTARYDYDQFQGWENRIAASGGVGYDFYKREKFELRGNLGAGFARTFGSERSWRPEGVAGVALVWRITEGQSFHLDTTYYPNFDDLPEFRLLSNANYSIGIGRIEGLNLKFGLKNDYDSVATGENNNLKYYGNLVYEF